MQNAPNFGYSHVLYLSLFIDRNHFAMSWESWDGDVNMNDQESGTRRSSRARRWDGDGNMNDQESDPWEWDPCGVALWQQGDCPLLTPPNRQDKDHQFRPARSPSPQPQWDDAGPEVYPHWPGVDDSDTHTPSRLNSDHPGVYAMQSLTEPEKFNTSIALLSTSLRVICYFLQKKSLNPPLCNEIFRDLTTRRRNQRVMTEIVDATEEYLSSYQSHYQATNLIADASRQKHDRYLAMYDYAENLYNLFVGRGISRAFTMLDTLLGVQYRPGTYDGFEYEFCPYVIFAKYQVETILNQLAETCNQPGIRALRMR